MHSAQTSNIYIIDDEPLLSEALADFLELEGYAVCTFDSAKSFVAAWPTLKNCDLLLSDINMPGMNGYDLCRFVRAQGGAVRLPVILMTGNDPNEKSLGLDAGADDFISKPVAMRNLVAKIRSLLEIRARETETSDQLMAARGRSLELTSKLECEVLRANRLELLRQFLSPNIANLLTVDDQRNLLKPHRADVTVVFSDLRRFTAFSEKAEPEDVLEVLEHYYTAVGQAAIKYKGTLGHLAGDGVMVFFNDPEPIANHTEVAIQMALEARKNLLEQRKVWQSKQYDIDFGMGISTGLATIGGIGFDHFSQYSVIGNVPNLASRLCSAADSGQILISRRVLLALQNCDYQAEDLGELNLKGIDKPLSVSNILSLGNRGT